MRSFFDKYKYLLSIVFFIVLLYFTGNYIFKEQSFPEIIDTIKLVNPYYLMAAVGMMAVFALCESTNMFFLLNELGQKTSFIRSMGYAFVGFYFAAITPSSTGGQPMQIYYMNRNKISMSVSSLVILIYLVVYQSVFLAYCGILYAVKYTFISAMIAPIRVFLIYGIFASACLICGVLFVIFSKNTALNIVTTFVNLLAKIKIIKNKEKTLENVRAQMDEYIKGAEYLRTHIKLLFKLCGVTFMQYTAYFSVPYFVYRSFGLLSNSYFNVIAAQSIVQLSAQSMPLPGAVGVSENSFYQIFQWIYPSNMVMPAMILSRGISFYAFMLVSGMITLLVHIRSVQNAKKATSTIKINSIKNIDKNYVD